MEINEDQNEIRAEGGTNADTSVPAADGTADGGATWVDFSDKGNGVKKVKWKSPDDVNIRAPHPNLVDGLEFLIGSGSTLAHVARSGAGSLRRNKSQTLKDISNRKDNMPTKENPIVFNLKEGYNTGAKDRVSMDWAARTPGPMVFDRGPASKQFAEESGGSHPKRPPDPHVNIEVLDSLIVPQKALEPQFDGGKGQWADQANDSKLEHEASMLETEDDPQPDEAYGTNSTCQ